MLRLHKEYNISVTAEVTRKLTKQYVGPFHIVEKVGCLAYKLDVPLNWRIHPVFFMAQMEPALSPAKNFFARLFSSNPPPMFVEGNTNKLKSFKVERLFNKQ